MVAGLGDAEDWDKCDADCDHAYAYGNHGKAIAPRQSAARAFQREKYTRLRKS
jgi:hypothetical protein